MYYLLKCNLPEIEREVKTEVLCKTADDIDYETNLLTDFCNMNSTFKISGFFDECKVCSELISSLKETISKLGNKMIIDSCAYDDDGNPQESINVQIAEAVLNRGNDVLLDPSNIASCLNFNIEVFVNKGNWHVGFFAPDGSYYELGENTHTVIPFDENGLWKDGYNPILWFGLKEEGPLQQWILSGDEDSMLFWFDEMDKNDFVERISDCDEATITWYFLECGYSPPELKSTLETCPIAVERFDTEISLAKKIMDYLMQSPNEGDYNQRFIDMIHMLENDNKNWAKVLFEQTGVILQTDGYLVSNAGYTELDDDVTFFRSLQGDYCEIGKNRIRTVNDLIEYILQADAFNVYLKDEDYGLFSKYELFYAVHYQIINAEENLVRKDGSIDYDWALSSISSANTNGKEYIVLAMPLISCNMGDICIPKDEKMQLSEFLELLVKELNNETKDNDYIPTYRVWNNHSYHIPNTYEEFVASFEPGGLLYRPVSDN